MSEMRVDFKVFDATPRLRLFYRLLRTVGVARREANFICWGLALGSGAGRVEARRLP